VIPAQKAGRIAEMRRRDRWQLGAGQRHDAEPDGPENVYVLGDASQQGDMPKSGFSANSQAKVCANAVRGALTGSRVFPARSPTPAGR
jgi:sulfide dehydrogenase [flavocytochrome c] flavoprotein subunit